jgi:hypothetical protein
MHDDSQVFFVDWMNHSFYGLIGHTSVADALNIGFLHIQWYSMSGQVVDSTIGHHLGNTQGKVKAPWD